MDEVEVDVEVDEVAKVEKEKQEKNKVESREKKAGGPQTLVLFGLDQWLRHRNTEICYSVYA